MNARNNAVIAIYNINTLTPLINYLFIDKLKYIITIA